MELENKGGNTAKPVNKKRILLSIVVVVYAVLAIVGITVVYYDPLFHFHGPKTGGNYLVDNQVYQNPGIARNFDYDSLIVGSSMTELLYPSLFEKEYGVHPVKVSYSGATTKNINIILNQAYNHHKGEIKYVFWGLDIYASEVPEDSLNMEQPEYLYDDKVFNDLSYILNKDIL